MTQCERILRHLQDYGTITSLEAVNEYGCMRLAARISDLRGQGHNITSESTKGKNRYGETTHYSTYKLVLSETDKIENMSAIKRKEKNTRSAMAMRVKRNPEDAELAECYKAFLETNKKFKELICVGSYTPEQYEKWLEEQLC